MSTFHASKSCGLSSWSWNRLPRAPGASTSRPCSLSKTDVSRPSSSHVTRSSSFSSTRSRHGHRAERRAAPRRGRSSSSRTRAPSTGTSSVAVGLDLHQLAAVARRGVEHDERARHAGGVDLLDDRLLRGGDQLGRDRRDPRVVAQAVLVGPVDARAGDDVVELVEQQQLPRLVERGGGIRAPVARRARRGDRPQLGRAQRLLVAAVGPLDRAVRRVGAPVVLEVELADPHRQVGRLRRAPCPRTTRPCRARRAARRRGRPAGAPTRASPGSDRRRRRRSRTGTASASTRPAARTGARPSRARPRSCRRCRCRRAGSA